MAESAQQTSQPPASAGSTAFPCRDCGREFASITSRNRHARNHLKDLSYICPVCNVAFYRHDILTRHMKLHEGEDEDGGHGNDDDDAGRKQGAVRSKTKRRLRKRCHTACDHCRASKIKCDGLQPCSACRNSERTCKFDSASNRISRFINQRYYHGGGGEGGGRGDDGDENGKDDHPQWPFADHTSQTMDGSENISQDNIVSDSSGHIAPDQAPMTWLSPSWNEHQPLGGLAALNQFTVNGGSGSGSGNGTASQFFYPSPTDAMSWTWMHENAFLSDETNASMMSLVSADIGFPVDLCQVVAVAPVSEKDQQQHEVMNEASVDGLHAAADLPLAPTTNDSAAAADGAGLEHLSEARSGLDGPTAQTQRTHAIYRQTCCRREVIDDLVSAASRHIAHSDAQKRRCDWSSASKRVAAAFQFLHSPEDKLGDDTTALATFVELYFEHFHPLWPLLSLQQLDYDSIHPLLFLTLSSIGAMYRGRLSCEYGSMMHTALCERLTGPLEFEFDKCDERSNLVWLAQARLLTQVAALYFGQHKAFSFAQHLGVLLVAQVRKLDLFSHLWYRDRMELFRRVRGVWPDEERLGVWLEVESHKRLAFGIFRGDTFTSIMLGTKPLISLDEIDLEFPACSAIWSGPAVSTRQALDIIDHDQRISPQPLLASDAFHIMMDRDEVLPPLEPLTHELLLFGLQQPLWRFSRDDRLFERLTGSSPVDMRNGGGGGPAPGSLLSAGLAATRPRRRDSTVAETESLDTLSREMADLQDERQRLLSALQKWERALPIVKTFVRNEQDRSFILSSLILFHMGHMRLLAPVADAHRIQYRLADSRSVDGESLRCLSRWAHLPQARLAVGRASSIWSLVTREVRGLAQSRVNLLAYVGLHHGAALLWAFVGCRKDKSEREWLSEVGYGEYSPSQPSLSGESYNDENNDTDVDGEGDGDANGNGDGETSQPTHAQLFQRFVDVYDLVGAGRWSSFAEAAKVLTENEFPKLPK